QRMVADAEANREEDKKFHELVQARNQADGLIHATRTAITEHGSKVGGDVIGKVEAALSDLETAMKGDDKVQIEARTKTLEEAGQSLYAAAAAAEQGGSADAASGNAQASKAADDVVDAEFTEVKDDKK
ncbi:UNVERIFIED_CONTAM: molecular chaperone DnaK, partial [Clostridioides difficile]